MAYWKSASLSACLITAYLLDSLYTESNLRVASLPRTVLVNRAKAARLPTFWELIIYEFRCGARGVFPGNISRNGSFDCVVEAYERTT
jgi:hypothetical protein